MNYEKLISMAAAVALVAGGLVIVTPAIAQNGKNDVVVRAIPEDVPVRYVRYNDLNLVNEAGEQSLIRRVKLAVRSVCYESGEANSPLYLDPDCRSESWGRAKPQVDRAIMRARQMAQNGHSSITPVAIVISTK